MRQGQQAGAPAHPFIERRRAKGNGERKLVPATQRIVDDLEAFLAILPAPLQEAVRRRGDVNELIEVVMDLGRVPEARFLGEQAPLSEEEVTPEGIRSVIEKLGAFGDDNRAGVPRTLHRFSALRNRVGEPVGLTCRVGRAVFGSVRLIEDLVRSDESILLLGRPGVGKTTILREVARVLADDAGKRVVVVDTSNEIAGDGDVPHPAIGRARRLQVPRTDLQHRVMIEAVENHMPEVIIIDEMSTELEALAARTIAERGVQLVATAHGSTLDNLIANPSLSDLVGGMQTVTLGDLEARRRGTQKTVLERKHEPTFDIVVEIRERNHVAVHREVGTVVDLVLRGYPPAREVRWMDSDGAVHAQIEESDESASDARPPAFDMGRVHRSRVALASPRQGRSPAPVLPAAPASELEPGSLAPLPVAPDGAPVKIHPFGIPRATLQEAIGELRIRGSVLDTAEGADFFLTTKSHYNRRPTEVREAERQGVPVYVLRRGTTEQIARFLSRLGAQPGQGAPSRVAPPPDRGHGNGLPVGRVQAEEAGVNDAIEEARTAVDRVLSGERRVSLAPQSSFIRRLQHGLAARHDLGSASTGREPGRRVVIQRRRR